VSHKRLNLIGNVGNYALEADSASNNAQPHEIAIASTTQVSDIQELLGATSDTITSLFRLSIVIRNATPRDRYVQATGTLPAFDDMLKLDTNHVASKFPRIGRDEDMKWLEERLGYAITMRRQYLYYCAHHRMSMEDPEGQEALPQDRSQADIDLKSQTPKSLPPITKASTLRPSMIDIDTDFDKNRTEDVPTFEEAAPSFATSVETNDGNLRRSIVPLPAFRNGEDTFECIYCHTIQTIKNEKSWQ
jgi:hypothetical protein